MSYYQPEQYSRGWTSVEDIEKSLVSASRITQDTAGAQLGYIPPIPEPVDPQNELHPDPFSMFNRRHNGPFTIMGRGQMIIEKEMACNVGIRDLQISRELGQGVPGLRGYSDSSAQEIISSSGQFDDCDEVHPDEPTFVGLKFTSTPSSSAIKEAQTLSTKLSALVEHDFSDNPQDAVDPYGVDDVSLSQSNASAGHPDSSSRYQETSLDGRHSYSDAFFYSFDESVYVKVEDPVRPCAAEALTPSPCSSPLPNHSAIDGHFVGCVQMESDSSSSPSPIFDMLPNRSATDFITQLRTTLPDDYHEVMSIWKDYQAGQISYSALELQIDRMLGPYPNLIDAFFKFTSLSPSEEPESLIVESSNGEIPDVHQAVNQLNSGVLPASGESIREVPAAPVIEVCDEPMGEAIQNPAKIVPKTEHQVNPRIRVDMFDDYIKFCRRVRNEFDGQPEVFTKFVTLLNDHHAAKIDKESMIEGVTRLFLNHRELIQEFETLTAENFCSMVLKTAASAAAHSAPKKVARLTDSTRPRRCRNAVILNLLKKEKARIEDLATPAEAAPIRLVGDEEPQKNHVKDQTGTLNEKTCDFNGNSDVGESVSVSNDLGIPSSTTLGYNRDGVDICVVSSTVLDDIDNSHCEPCKLVSVQDVNLVETGLSCDLTAQALKSEDTDFPGLRLNDLAYSLPLSLDQDKPLELLKPEDIIPDMNAEPHSTLDMVDETVSSAMDSIAVEDVAEEVASVDNNIGSSELLKPEDIITEMQAEVLLGTSEAEIVTTPVVDSTVIQLVVADLVETPVESELRGADGCDIAEIELLKPSDFVHLEPSITEGNETVLDVPVITPAITPSTTTLDAPGSLIVEGTDEEMALSDSVEVSGDDFKSVDAVSSSIGAAVISADSVSSFDDGNPSSAKISSDVLGQDQCCDVGSSSDSIPQCEVLKVDPIDDTEQVLDTVVVALAKMDLNSDTDTDSLPLVEVTKLDSSGDSIFADAIPLPLSSDESSEKEHQVIDESTETEVTMTVQALPDADLSPDQDPQVTPDSGPLLLRPDQFVTLSTAVDPHQVQQALQNTLPLVHSTDLIPLD